VLASFLCFNRPSSNSASQTSRPKTSETMRLATSVVSPSWIMDESLNLRLRNNSSTAFAAQSRILLRIALADNRNNWIFLATCLHAAKSMAQSLRSFPRPCALHLHVQRGNYFTQPNQWHSPYGVLPDHVRFTFMYSVVITSRSQINGTVLTEFYPTMCASPSRTAW
jgi:hypothetical protein